jgi:hypothetical protein
VLVSDQSLRGEIESASAASWAEINSLRAGEFLFMGGSFLFVDAAKFARKISHVGLGKDTGIPRPATGLKMAGQNYIFHPM